MTSVSPQSKEYIYGVVYLRKKRVYLYIYIYNNRFDIRVSRTGTPVKDKNIPDPTIIRQSKSVIQNRRLHPVIHLKTIKNKLVT